MELLDANAIERLCPLPDLIGALKAAFAAPMQVPDRQTTELPGGGGERLLLSMPAFALDGSGMVKLATVYPDNRLSSMPTIQGAIIAFANNGSAVAVLDAGAVTRLRTAAASALAASFLARSDTTKLLIIGTGALPPYLAAAHAAVRPIREVSIWGRDVSRVRGAVTRVRAKLPNWIEVQPVYDLPAAVGAADIVSCATSSPEPLLRGNWLRQGAFVDLVGNFSPVRSECDDRAVEVASIYVDTWSGAMMEAGELLGPIARGVIKKEDIRGELSDLVRGNVAGRTKAVEITLFKSVGTAIEDLAAVQLIRNRLADSPDPPTTSCEG